MIFFLIVVGSGAVALLVQNVFLSNQNHELLKEVRAARATLSQVAKGSGSVETCVVLADVALERRRQVEIGWSPEHDDKHSTRRMVILAWSRVHAPRANSSAFTRRGLVQGVAVLVAAIESMDRHAAARAEVDR